LGSMPLRVVFIGAPGVGKGTFAGIVCKQLGWKHFNMGATMREHVAGGTPLGVCIRDELAAGKLLPDGVVNELALDYLGGAGIGADVLIDGYPRTVGQAELLLSKSKGHKLLAMHIKLDRWVCVEKLLARQECKTCGRGFNTAHIVTRGFDMPAILPNPSTCPRGTDKCAPVLSTRNDDTRETIEHRFNEFYQRTQPVLDVFRAHGALSEFTVTKGIADAPALLKQLQERIN